MSEERDNQTLDELLRLVAERDQQLAPSDRVEQRVMAHWDARIGAREERTVSAARGWWLVPAVGAMAVIALALFAGRGSRPSEPGRTQTTAPSVARGSDAQRATILPNERPAPTSVVAVEGQEPPAPPIAPRRAADPVAGTRIVDAEPEFVPLMPMGAHDLSGPLQLVQVRMRRATLAGLGVPLDVYRVGDPVQAEVLLGEDGMARAIRISRETDSGGLR